MSASWKQSCGTRRAAEAPATTSPAEVLALAIAGLADLAMVEHWASDGARPALEEIPGMVLTLLLGTRSPAGDP